MRGRVSLSTLSTTMARNVSTQFLWCLVALSAVLCAPNTALTQSEFTSNSSNSQSTSSPSSSTTFRGVAKVTPISFQGTSVRVGNVAEPETSASSRQLALPTPLSTVSAIIPIVNNSFNRKPLFAPSSYASPTPSRRPKALTITNATVAPPPPPTTTVHPSLSDSNLCFLAHGGSSETFAVNEAASVGSVIGAIKVIGNASTTIELAIITNDDNSGSSHSSGSSGAYYQHPSIGYNTNESVLDDIIPIRIEQGTNRLVLARKLDKESPEGESGISISVRCRPKRSRAQRQMSVNNEPGNYAYQGEVDNDDIIIPIRILITDANDNKPEWQGELPYRVNISETTPVGSVIFSQLRAIDNDQLGPYSTVEYHVESGPFSHLLRFPSPLEGTLVLASPLDYETLPKFWVNIRAQDQGNPPNSATTRLEVRVLDADDQNPRFEVDKYTAVVHEGQRAGQVLDVEPKAIKAEDPDRAIRSTIVYAFNSEGEEREAGQFRIDPNTGAISLARALSPTTLLPLTLVIRATQRDNRDRYALTTLTVLNQRQAQVSGAQLRFLHSNYTTALLESTPAGHPVLTVHTSGKGQSTTVVDSRQSLRYQILDDEDSQFGVRSNGEIVLKKQLDFERMESKSFRVMVTDGRQSDVARVTVQVINVNEHDPVFSSPTYTFHVNEARLKGSPVIGQIEASDADRGDKVHIALTGPHAYAFAYSGQDGLLRVRNLRMLNTTECHMIATATDSGTPPRSSSASVVVRFTPTLVRTLIGAQSRMRGAEPAGFSTDWNQDENEELTGSLSAADILQQSASDLFAASTNSTALVLVIVLGVLLGTLFIIIVALTLHVLKNRKYERRSVSPTAAVLHHHHHHRELGSGGSSIEDSSAVSSASSTSSSGDGGYNDTNGVYSHYQAPTSNRTHFQHNLAKTSIPLASAVPGTGNAVSAALNNTAVTPGVVNGQGKNTLFNGLRLSAGSAKVSPMMLNAADSDESGMHEHYHHHHTTNQHSTHHLHHSHHHHHHQHHHQQQQSQQQPLQRPHHLLSSDDDPPSTGSEPPKFVRKTFMDSDASGEDHKQQHPKTATSAGSSDSGVVGGEPPSDSSDGSRSSSADLINNSANQGTGGDSVGSRISVIKWPQGSIPRRVKKLTWQDEQRNNHLDAMYTQNDTVSIPSSNNITQTSVHPTNTTPNTKTKTLSGHLLTGVNHHSQQQQQHQQPPHHHHHQTSTSTSGARIPHSVTSNATKSFGQFVMSAPANSTNELEPVVPNKSALHYHLYAPPPHLPSQQQNNASSGNSKSTLSDLTVYF